MCRLYRKRSTSKMLLSLLLIAWMTVGSMGISQVEYETRAKILIKQAGGEDRVIYLGSPPSYEELVKRSTAIMDKSGLVKRYIIEPKLLLVTAPPKWGKSTNLDMLRFFLESEHLGRNLPKDKTALHDRDHQFKDRMRGVAFEFFKRGTIYDHFWKKLHKYEQPPAIASSNDMLNKYCGKFPVIYVNFTSANWTGNDFQSMINDLKIVLSQTFKKHEYALTKLEKTVVGKSLTVNQQKVLRRNIGTLQRFMKGEENSPVELQCSLQFLSITLRNHYLKYVHILIDDYDLVYRKYVLENNCSKLEADKIDTFFRTFFKETFVSNPFLEKAFVTGLLRLRIAEDFKHINGPFHQYFGFTKNEISRLFYVLNITYDLGQNARKWYGNYHTYERLEPTVYNPWSIAHFSNSKEVKNYIHTATNTTFFKKMLKNHNVSCLFERFLYNRNVPLWMEEVQFDSNILIKLQSLLTGEFPDETQDDTRYVLHYMLALGYLIMDMDYETKRTIKPFASVNVRIPNLEVFEQIADLVFDSYTDGWNETATDTLEQASAELSKIIGDTENEIDTSSLAALLSRLFQFMVNNEEDLEADFGLVMQKQPYLVHRIMFMVAFNARAIGNYELEGKTSFARTAPADKLRPDFGFYHGTRATIIETTNGSNCTLESFAYMNSTLRFNEKFFKARVIPIQSVRWIDIRVYPNGSVTIDQKQNARNITSS
ncbi:uncharacterized protein LOC135833747 isoform X2 [Planococcus citri]